MRPRQCSTESCIRLAISVLTLAVIVSCAGRRSVAAPVAPVEPPATRDIEALIERGCFRCLEQALAPADQRNQSQLAFESAVLLVLRATELGLPADPWMARARVLAADDSTWAQYLEMVAAVPPGPRKHPGSRTAARPERR